MIKKENIVFSDEQRNLLVKAVNDATSALNAAGKVSRRSMDYYRATKKWREANADLAKYDRLKLQTDLNISLVRKILKEVGIPISKTFTTAVKGWHDHSSGYKIFDSHISFRGYSKEKKIVMQKLVDNGYEYDVDTFNNGIKLISYTKQS